MLAIAVRFSATGAPFLRPIRSRELQPLNACFRASPVNCGRMLQNTDDENLGLHRPYYLYPELFLASFRCSSSKIYPRPRPYN